MEALETVEKKALYHPGDGIVHKAKDGAWRFDEAVSKVFDSHVSKSVPFYEAGHELIVRLSDYFVRDDSLCYEIGCSTGTLTLKLVDKHRKNKDVKIVGIDPSEGMIATANEKARQHPDLDVTYYCNDAIYFDFEKSDLVVMYYVCQFVHPKNRLTLMKKVYQSLNEGGALMFFEKVRESNSEHNECISQIYMDYKSDQGFDAAEI